tara:strand:+ start:69 stop:338 length:270 start_codon:yes stop_codon:yes gene_type:complete
MIIKITTMTKQEITTAIEKKGLHNQIVTADNSRDGYEYIGFSKDNTVFFWFIVYDNLDVTFDNRYNSANGSCIKTFNQHWKALGILGLQ